MADVTVSAAWAANESRNALWGPYWASPSVGYIAGINNAGQPTVEKTDDSGATWTPKVGGAIRSGHRGSSAWWDQETPGDSGTIIHMAYLDSAGSTVFYLAYDTSDDTFDSEVDIDTLTISQTSADSDSSITKSKSGRVYVAARGDFEADTENTDHSMRSSSDRFVTSNESELSPYSSDEEIVRLFPGADADEDDICALVFDAVNQDMEFWKFDASANTWSVTAIDTAMALTAANARLFPRFFDGVSRHSDEDILVMYWNDLDTATADFRSAEISQATPTITQKANIDSNTDDSFTSGPMINQQNDDVYVAYLGSDAGDETWNSTLRCYYKLSTDNMGTWGTEQAYGVQNDDHKIVSGGRTVGNAGGRWMPVWFNDDLNDILVNDGNDIEIAAASVGENPDARDFIPRVMIY